ncbi:MAG: hypothetical protein L0Y74_01740 [candidate division Zixibacteria bacterium]|nr:hypothetical protein [candidate division Zixibacteria bacterium]
MKKLTLLPLFLVAVAFLTAGAEVPQLMNFQGILTDPAGVPLANDTNSVLFTIYDAPAGGSSKWSETQSVATDAQGRFNISLGAVSPIDDTVFKQMDRYLGIKIGADAEMSPRTQIVSVGFTQRISTLDGSASGGTITGTGSGTGIWIKDVTYALRDSTSSYGVWSVSSGISGVVGEGESRGIWGYCSPVSGEGTGVYGNVVASALSSTDKGVYGTSDNFGVYGDGDDVGTYGTGGSIGVQGEATANTSYGGNFNGELYGVFGQGIATAGIGAFGVYGSSSSVLAGDAGVYGSSDEYAVYGNTSSGAGDWGLYTPDDIFVGGACTGCLSSFAARNGSNTPLEAGTPVTIMGAESPLISGSQPVMVVRPAQAGDEVVGIVLKAAKIVEIPVHSASPMVARSKSPVERLSPEEYTSTDQNLPTATGTLPQTARLDEASFPKEKSLRYSAGAAQPGSLLVIVTHGPTYVKVDGSVSAGNLLVAGSRAGIAQVAEPILVVGINVAPAGVIGKVLGQPDATTGLVPVLVTLK